ncbi:MAG: sigma-54-dependent Fis family transcriptional regulator [Proteobacteria bacterium]|nr:MAG: sigma-54-dependent Fis family transcriptional regulator [Pseudomonadota bacterium]
MAKVLVIDDEHAFRDGILETLSDLGAEAIGVSGVTSALKLIETKAFDLIFIDFRMPDIDGLQGIKLIQQKMGASPPAIVMITALFDSQNTIAAMKLGAFDHLTKPVTRADIQSVLDKLTPALKPAQKIAPEYEKLLDRYAIVGNSPQLREVLKLIGKLASHDNSVLITGETGTGKELVARAIHGNSERADKPFVAINCAAIPENLLESELFGHIKGAFTGASHDRKGSFQLAEGGTLLLDEIGDMSLSLQAKLLRTLQEKEITPLGSNKSIKINVRFLAATHQNLPAMIAKKEFREDLYYRLNVVEIRLPALRERLSDIPILAKHFLDQKPLSPAAQAKLQEHSWPGNIRELKNVIERALVVASGSWIEAQDIRFLLDNRVSENSSESLDLPSAVAHLEKTFIDRALKEASGNRSEAARKLGIQRQLLYAKIKEYRIDS